MIKLVHGWTALSLSNNVANLFQVPSHFLVYVPCYNGINTYVRTYGEVKGQGRITSTVWQIFIELQGISLLAALFGSFLMTWVVFFLIQKWNEKVIKETVKSAVS